MIECLFPSYEGLEPPDWLRRLVAEGVGGVVLFSSNLRDREQLAELTEALRSENDKLLIALDEEGGDVTRIDVATGSSYPGNGALGAVDDVSLTERVAASIGAELAAAGVNLDFAPVADVNVNPENPVIGARSFGSDPELVARHVAAFVRGLQEQGVAGCAKHFPGHGATDRDSHVELPTLAGDVADGMPPFRAAIEAGVQSIMTAHIRVPQLGDDPATVNPRALTILRDDLGYDGLVIADALEMRGLADTIGIEEGGVRALSAGVDALIVGRDLGADAVARVREAIARVPEDRLAEAAERVRRVAAWADARGGKPDLDAGIEAARRALVVEGDVELHGPAEIRELRPEANFAAGRARHALTYVIPSVSGGELVLVVRDAHRYPWMREQVEANPGAIVVEVGLPYWRPPVARGYIATYGGSRASYEAVAERLQARVPA
ncbi:MAG TPA: glycoside hydrolase family 3 protein [Gaiellaceae bacterium]